MMIPLANLSIGILGFVVLLSSLMRQFKFLKDHNNTTERIKLYSIVGVLLLLCSEFRTLKTQNSLSVGIILVIMIGFLATRLLQNKKVW